MWPAVACHERGHRHTDQWPLPGHSAAAALSLTGAGHGAPGAPGGRRRLQEAAGEEGEKGDSKAFGDDFFTLGHPDS